MMIFDFWSWTSFDPPFAPAPASRTLTVRAQLRTLVVHHRPRKLEG